MNGTIELEELFGEAARSADTPQTSAPKPAARKRAARQRVDMMARLGRFPRGWRTKAALTHSISMVRGVTGGTGRPPPALDLGVLR